MYVITNHITSLSMEWSHQELIAPDFAFQFFGTQTFVQIQIRLLVPNKVIIYKQNIYLCLLLSSYSIMDLFLLIQCWKRFAPLPQNLWNFPHFSHLFYM